MGAEGESLGRIGGEDEARSCYLYKFKLYETRSVLKKKNTPRSLKMNWPCQFSLYVFNQCITTSVTQKFYVIGRNKSRSLWRVLKIDRLEPTELNIREDPTAYTEIECYDLLKRIHEGNKATGGLKFVTKCYGIVGFIKFLGPYYMLLITERRQIGVICGHTIYAINKTGMIPIPNSSVHLSMSDSKNENRYKKLLCTVDLTKDFFFSYSYRIMCSVQKNLCEEESGHVLYETMFVWNEFLTRGIRNHLKNTIWTVALVYGFFRQAKLSVGRKDFELTIIARRSRHYAGTRYLKRGVNEKGRVANDVETEQIVFKDNPEEHPLQISSVVQNRGSIPLFWSQETSRLNIKPDIILHKKDVNYDAARLHFENLVKRYGNPIIILNLIKRHEKRPRESILRGEFANAIDFINKDLTVENRLRFLHWDLHKHSRSKATNVLSVLEKVTERALKVTGFFYCQLTPSLKFDGPLKSNLSQKRHSSRFFVEENDTNEMEDKDVSEVVSQPESLDFSRSYVKSVMLQKGVLRTNCIDCLDRTNVAQYTYGLAALGHQLCALGLMDYAKIDLDTPLADDLMSFYEKMGDTLAFQYGGSAAHNKIFSERRGQWKAATQSQEFFRTLQRYYNNAYMDADKQDSINIFLGHFQPQPGKPTLWELRYGEHDNIGQHANSSEDKVTRNAIFKRSLSDGNILCESKTPVSSREGEKKFPSSSLPEIVEYAGARLSESTPEISTCETDASYSRCTPSIAQRELFPDLCPKSDHICFKELEADDELDCSNFLDLDWLSSSENSCEEETSESCALTNSPFACLSLENVINGVNMATTQSPSGSELILKQGTEQTESRMSYAGVGNAEVLNEFSDSFIRWVNNGETLCY